MNAPTQGADVQPGWLPLPAEAGVQQLAVYGYGYRRGRQLLLQITDGAAARRWLGAVLAQGWLGIEALREISFAPREASGCALNLGFSCAGLQALGLPSALLAVLRQHAPAFSEGAVPRAAQRLGDTGDNAPPHWEAAFAHRAAHLLLTLQADTLHALDERAQALRRLEGAEGLGGWDSGCSDGQHLFDEAGRRIAHFGYVDGISNPRFVGLHREKDDQPPRHAPGELLLGHVNDDGANPWRLPEAPAAAAFFRHATFGAYRKIAQDEEAFHAQAEQLAQQLGESPEWVMAKWCGRWRDGRLMRAPGAKAEAGADQPLYNGFAFGDDRRGEGCPMGSHLRRMNPRSDPLVQNKRRPLMRRGMPYGPRWTPDAALTPSPRDYQRNTEPRGLLGLFFCASLEDQFEHLLGSWADRNPLGPDNRGTAKDPLIGQHDDPNAWLEIPGAPGTPARRMAGLRPMVATRGTVYLLYLTQPALQALATGWGAQLPEMQSAPGESMPSDTPLSGHTEPRTSALRAYEWLDRSSALGLHRLSDIEGEHRAALARPNRPPLAMLLPSEPTPGDPLLFGVTAPRKAAPGAEFTVSFAAFVESSRKRALKQARSSVGPVARHFRDTAPNGSMCWSPGTPFKVILSGRFFDVAQPEQRFIWTGTYSVLTFAVLLRPSAQLSAVLTATVLVKDVVIATINAQIEVLGAAASSGETETAQITRSAPTSAFASYASKDIWEVAGRLSSLTRYAPGLKIFQDCLDLSPGEAYKPRLQAEISARDVFWLFWSRNAAASRWVMWELNTALSHKPKDAIVPMPLEDPALAPPPDQLKDEHFRDRFMIAGYGLMRVEDLVTRNPEPGHKG